MIKINRGIPRPARSRRGKWSLKYPWYEMKPGDSFIMPHDGNVGLAQRLASANVAYRHKATRSRFSVRTVTEKGRSVVRIWRIR